MSTLNNNQVTVQKNITEQVLLKIETFKQAGELRLPADYSPENALKAAYLVLLETKTREGKSVMEACTKESIANSLLKMVVWGLSPLKKQCDFIAYGDKLSCDPEYTGNIALAIRYGGLKYHKANAIFNGDDFKFEVGVDGRRKVMLIRDIIHPHTGELLGGYSKGTIGVVIPLDENSLQRIFIEHTEWVITGSSFNHDCQRLDKTYDFFRYGNHYKTKKYELSHWHTYISRFDFEYIDDFEYIEEKEEEVKKENIEIVQLSFDF